MPECMTDRNALYLEKFWHDYSGKMDPSETIRKLQTRFY